MPIAQNQAGATPEAGASTGATPGASTGQQPVKEGEGATPDSFETWLATQDESAKTIIADRFKALESTLKAERSSTKAERDERKVLDKRLKDLSKGLEEGSTAKAEVEKLRVENAEKDARVDFYAEAHTKGVSDIELAFYAAKQKGMIDDKGHVDFDDLKKQLPGLFTQPRGAPSAKVGAGMNTAPPKLAGNAAMNDFIRQSTGRT